MAKKMTNKETNEYLSDMNTALEIAEKNITSDTLYGVESVEDFLTKSEEAHDALHDFTERSVLSIIARLFSLRRK